MARSSGHRLLLITLTALLQLALAPRATAIACPRGGDQGSCCCVVKHTPDRAAKPSCCDAHGTARRPATPQPCRCRDAGDGPHALPVVFDQGEKDTVTGWVDASPRLPRAATVESRHVDAPVPRARLPVRVWLGVYLI